MNDTGKTAQDNSNFNFSIPLDGDWEFAYTADLGMDDAAPSIPDGLDFAAKMPVPGYWDDNLENLKNTGIWDNVRFNPNYKPIEFKAEFCPPDTSLPYLVGSGWYRTRMHVPSCRPGDHAASSGQATQTIRETQAIQATLEIGGARLETWVWLNGRFAGHHKGYLTPFTVPLDEYIKFGEENELVIMVTNARVDRVGCITRGYIGLCAGIYRPVWLKITGGIRIADCYIYTEDSNNVLNWLVELEGNLKEGEMPVINWMVRDNNDDSIMGEGSVPVQAYIQRQNNCVAWTTGNLEMMPWSDNSPKLYRVEIKLCQNGVIIDSYEQNYGLRRLEREGTDLRLNGRPVLLRGATEHCYYPLTCTPPSDINSYRNNIRRLKEIGFNWLRFHTWVPPEEYMQAADELGMMIQVEGPEGYKEYIDMSRFHTYFNNMKYVSGLTEQEWIDIFRTCRRHPSVVIYCDSNEECLYDEKIEFLRALSKLQHRVVPDGLFSPQEALPGVEGGGIEGDIISEEPFTYCPKRLNELREFTDVFEGWCGSFFSYVSTEGDKDVLDRHLTIFERPVLGHEFGIHGSYIDFDLQHRYEGTRTGDGLFTAAREVVEKAGVLHKASLYYKNSCAWMKVLRKSFMEKARMCRYITGYDFLGATDHHWHRSGYTCGIMNEFYELKYGESVRDVLKYNGESVILLEQGNLRNYYAGNRIKYNMYASLFGSGPMAEGRLYWYLSDQDNKIYKREEIILHDVKNGIPVQLPQMEIIIPQISRPSKMTVHARLSGGEYEIENSWDLWVFPENRTMLYDGRIYADAVITGKFGGKYKFLMPPGKNNDNDGNNEGNNDGSLRVVSEIDSTTLDFLVKGGRVILIGTRPFDTLPVKFQISLAGRTIGNHATVIENHPLIDKFPHDGYCDWQFFSMFEGGYSVVFNELNTTFNPILEVVGTYKYVHKQAAVFEANVGSGRLLVCTLNIDSADPAGAYLLDKMLEYACSDDFHPQTCIPPDDISRLSGRESNLLQPFGDYLFGV